MENIEKINAYFVLFSMVMAYFVPIELFLFSYAVLGPLHYLTEISWLSKKDFFLPRKNFVFVIAGLTILLLIDRSPKDLLTAFILLITVTEIQSTLLTQVLFLASGFAFAFYFNTFNWFTVLFQLLVGTLIHTYLFTGLFMYYGFRKHRTFWSAMGMALFASAPVILTVATYIMTTRPIVNELHFSFDLHFREFLKDVNITMGWNSLPAIAIKRIVAFSYTYHYLNWFIKTKTIKWYDVSFNSLSLIAALWILCVGLYLYDYRIGFAILAPLSLLHVFLEIPLNYKTVVSLITGGGPNKP